LLIDLLKGKERPWARASPKDNTGKKDEQHPMQKATGKGPRLCDLVETKEENAAVQRPSPPEGREEKKGEPPERLLNELADGVTDCGHPELETVNVGGKRWGRDSQKKGRICSRLEKLASKVKHLFELIAEGSLGTQGGGKNAR